MTKQTKAQRIAAAANTAAVLSNAGFTFRRNRAATIATLREVTGWKNAKNKAGEWVTVITDEARESFLRGDMAARMNPDADTLTAAMLADAREVLKRKGASTKAPKAGEIIRTPAQEAMYAAARVALSALLAEAGIRTNQKRGGNRGTKEAASEPSAVEKASIEADKANAAATREALETPKTPASARAYAVQQAATMLAYCDKHKAMVSEAMRRAVVAFHKAAMALPAE